MTVAPFSFREKSYELIERETNNAKNGKFAKIIAKMNSLVDTMLIEKLYEASLSGVEIILIVRGICTLVPGVKGLSENITVKSIVGDCLEHSRIYYFHNDGDYEVYLSSADWMTRNLERRIELFFPVENSELKKRLLLFLKLFIKDNEKSWYLENDGNYIKRDYESEPINSQEILRNMKYTRYKEQLEKLERILSDDK